jgi:hypothetical protein
LRDDSISFASHNLEKKFKELLENYLGVDFGNPVHGKVNLNLTTIAENVEKWVKQVLNKEIKKHIKEMPAGKYIHSIRFEPSISGSSEMKIVYKDGSHRHMHQWEFLRGVRAYIESLGYKRISADNA